MMREEEANLALSLGNELGKAEVAGSSLGELAVVVADLNVAGLGRR